MNNRPYYNLNWNALNHYRASLHNHSTNSDGNGSPSAVVQKFKDAGYNIIAITDHQYITPDPGVTGVLFVPGYEWSHGKTNNGYGAHVVVLYPDNNQVLPTSTNINTVVASGQIVINAHVVSPHYVKYYQERYPGNQTYSNENMTVSLLSDIIDWKRYGSGKFFGQETAAPWLPPRTSWYSIPPYYPVSDLSSFEALDAKLQCYRFDSHDFHQMSTDLSVPPNDLSVTVLAESLTEAAFKDAIVNGRFYISHRKTKLRIEDDGDKLSVRILESDCQKNDIYFIGWGRNVLYVKYNTDYAEYRYNGGEVWVMPFVDHQPDSVYSGRVVSSGNATLITAEHPVYNPPRPKRGRGSSIIAYNTARSVMSRIRSMTNEFLGR